MRIIIVSPQTLEVLRSFRFAQRFYLSLFWRVTSLQHRIAEVPLPVRIRSHPTDPVSSYLSSKHRTKSVPPKPNCFVADLNASFVQKIFHVTEWERKTNVQHHSQADDLRTRFKVPEWGVFFHTERLRDHPARLKLVLSDSASSAIEWVPWYGYSRQSIANISVHPIE